MNATRFPDLLTLARRFLAVAGSSVPSEVVFSAAGVLLTKRRNAPNPSNVDAQIFLRKNHLLKSARSQPSTIEKGKIDRILILPEEEEAAEPPLPDLYRGVGRCFEMGGGAGAKWRKGARKRGVRGASPGKFLENGPPNLSFWVVSRRMKQDQGL